MMAWKISSQRVLRGDTAGNFHSDIVANNVFRFNLGRYLTPDCPLTDQTTSQEESNMKELFLASSNSRDNSNENRISGRLWMILRQENFSALGAYNAKVRDLAALHHLLRIASGAFPFWNSVYIRRKRGYFCYEVRSLRSLGYMKLYRAMLT